MHLVDYVAMDLKAPLAQLPAGHGRRGMHEDIERSIRIVIESGLSHELRTTYEESLLSLGELREIALLARGSRLMVLQSFRPTKALDKGMLARPARRIPRASKGSARAIEETGVPLLIR